MTTSVDTHEHSDAKPTRKWGNTLPGKILEKVYDFFSPHPNMYFSLRWKLLVGFTLIFSVVFTLAFFWFYQFATDTSLARIQDELTATLEGGASGVNVEELLALVREGQPNSAGFSNDPRLQNQLNWLEAIHQIEPRAWPYIYIPGSRPGEIVYLVDLLSLYNPSRADRFPYTKPGDNFSLGGLEKLTLRTVEGRFDTYTDEWGGWVSAYAPIKDKDGKVVAAMGIDFEAGYVDQMNRSIVERVAPALLVTYLVLFVLVFVFSRALTHPIVALTRAAQTLGGGMAYHHGSATQPKDSTKPVTVSHNDEAHSTDEIDILANTFDELTYSLAERTVELEKMNMMLKEMDRTKIGFIEISGHELRTPLTLVKGYAQMLEQRIQSDEEAQTLVKGMLSGTDRLMEIVNNMLDVSRIDSKTLKVVADNSVYINMLIMREEGIFRTALQERNLTLTMEGLADLPSIPADPHLLSKVFYHLIINAIKYTPDGGRITITGRIVEEHPKSPEMEVVIADTGIGIAPEYHELIFEKFFQMGEVMLHSSGKTKFKGGGPGLGLAIARGIIEAHAGRIWVESAGYSEETYPGSKFYVRLPLPVAQREPLHEDQHAPVGALLTMNNI